MRICDHIVMSSPHLFQCGQKKMLTQEISCQGIKQQACWLHTDASDIKSTPFTLTCCLFIPSSCRYTFV